MIVATVESTAPATAAGRMSPLSAARSPIEPMVAVLEMNPEARPAIGSPKRAPTVRTAMYPAALMAMMRITSIQMEWGFNESYGPIGRFGTSGKITRSEEHTSELQSRRDL